MITRRKFNLHRKHATVICFTLATLCCYSQEKDQPAHVLINDIIYSKNDTLKADFYLPQNYRKQENPVLIFIDGFGSDFRGWDHYKDWSRFTASEGFIGIVYSSRKDCVKKSFENLLSFLFMEKDKYFIDTTRVAVYAGSGNVRQALPLANADRRIKAALIYYGAAIMDQFRLDMPVLLVRAGLDNIQLNRQLDSMAFKALMANAPYTIINLNTSIHAFEDINDPEAKYFMKGSLDFLKRYMRENFRADVEKKKHQVSAMRELYQSNWIEALAALQLALKTNPADNEIKRQIGNVYVELKEYEKAISFFNDALKDGNWRKGEIAQKKIYAYAKLDSIDAAVAEMRILKEIGWFQPADYEGNKEFANITTSEVYKEITKE